MLLALINKNLNKIFNLKFFSEFFKQTRESYSLNNAFMRYCKVVKGEHYHYMKQTQLY